MGVWPGSCELSEATPPKRVESIPQIWRIPVTTLERLPVWREDGVSYLTRDLESRKVKKRGRIAYCIIASSSSLVGPRSEL
jgi:hypothetical protein